MPKARLDLEKDKFDSEGRVKVSIENVSTTGSDQDVVVKNTSSDPVPVSIVNPDSNIDIQVEIQPNITIDDTTPVDVNVTNTSVNTNATIQGTPNVSVTNAVDIDDATAIRVDVTNASLTSTLSGTSSVNVTNSELTTKNQLEYTDSDITAL